MNTDILKISKSKFEQTVLLISIYSISCINLPYLSGYLKTKYFFIVIIGIILAKKTPCFFRKKFLTVNFTMIIFCVFVIIPSVVNKENSLLRNTFLASIVFVAICIETLFTMEYIAEKQRIFEMLKLYYILTLLVVIFTDVIAIISPGLFGNESLAARYLVGTKFDVMYLHLQLIVLYLTKINLLKNFKIRNWITLSIYMLLTFGISRLIDCNTGLIGCLLLMAIFPFSRVYLDLISSPKFFVGVLLLSCSFVFFYELFLQNIFVQKIISDTLGRSLTLTGRTDIYAVLPIVLSKHIFLGYGYGSAFEISMSFFGYADTQNGLAQWLISIGIFGTTALLIWIYSVFKEWKKIAIIKQEYVPIIILLYIYSILASIEITINYTYIFWIAFIVGISMEKNSISE